GVNKTQARTLPSLSLTFWLLLISTVIFGILSLFNGSMILVTDLALIADLSALALIATVISNFLLVYAIKHIGSTNAAILGAVEPVTAVILGIILFGEALNAPIVIGVLLIFTAVGIVVMRNRK
ncbi:MAG: DMT family transporter, partial [Muribaculaceae bacterium]